MTWRIWSPVGSTSCSNASFETSFSSDAASALRDSGSARATAPSRVRAGGGRPSLGSGWAEAPAVLLREAVALASTTSSGHIRDTFRSRGDAGPIRIIRPTRYFLVPEAGFEPATRGL